MGTQIKITNGNHTVIEGVTTIIGSGCKEFLLELSSGKVLMLKGRNLAIESFINNTITITGVVDSATFGKL